MNRCRLFCVVVSCLVCGGFSQDGRLRAQLPETKGVSGRNSTPEGRKQTQENIRTVLWEKPIVWNATPGPNRPAIAFVIREHYMGLGYKPSPLRTPAVNTLKAAEWFACCGYDVTLIVGVPQYLTFVVNGSAPSRSRYVLEDRTVGEICDGIVRVNTSLAKRRDEKRFAGRVNLLQKPSFFSNGKELNDRLLEWGRESFGLSSPTRAPFGWIVFSGKGELSTENWGDLGEPAKYEHHFIAGDASVPYRTGTAREIDREKTDDRNNELIIETAARRLYTECHAPLLVVGDICSPEEKLGLAREGATPSQVAPWGARTIEVPATLNDAGVASAIEAVEKLRSAMRADAGVFTDDWKYEKCASFLMATAAGISLSEPEVGGVDKSFLAFLADKMRILEGSGSPAELTFAFHKNADQPDKTSLRLGTVFEAYCKYVAPNKEESDGVDRSALSPRFLTGPIGRELVFASLDPAHEYVTPRLNLLAADMEAVTKDEDNFLSIERDVYWADKLARPSRIRSGELVIRSPDLASEAGHPEYRFAVVKFANPLRVNRGMKLVLHVRAVSRNSKQAINFVIGALNGAERAYEKDPAKFASQLSSLFSNYPAAPSFNGRLQCDGTAAFYEIPLDRVTKNTNLLDGLEIQPPPLGGTFPKGITLTVLGAYVVPATWSSERLQKEIKRDSTVAASGHNWIGEWACNTPLRSDDRNITRKTVTRADGSRELVVACDNAKDDWSGMIGYVYPQRLLEKGTGRINFRVGSIKASGDARIAVCFYSGNRILGAWEGKADDAASGIEIELQDTGYVGEIAVLSKEVNQLSIEELRIQDKVITTTAK